MFREIRVGGYSDKEEVAWEEKPSFGWSTGKCPKCKGTGKAGATSTSQAQTGDGGGKDNFTSTTEIAELEMQIPALRAFVATSSDEVQKKSMTELLAEKSLRFKILTKTEAINDNFKHNSESILNSLKDETRDHDNAWAELMLGVAYCVGNGVAQDFDAAVKHTTRAIEIESKGKQESPGVREFLRYCQEYAILSKSKKAEQTGDMVAASNGFSKLAASPFPDIKASCDQALKRLRANPAIAANDESKKADKALTNALNYANNRMLDDAIDMLKDLIRDYPDTGAARQAAREIERLKAEILKDQKLKK